jgi:hypothetical protein
MPLSEQLAGMIPEEAKRAKLDQEMTHQPAPYNPWPNVLQKVDAAGNWINDQIPSMEVPFDYQPGGEAWTMGEGYDLDRANLEKVTSLGMNMIDPGAKAMPGVAGIFAGRWARNADHAALAEAERMEQAGHAAEDIWRTTGWGRGPVDNKWRFEIDDSQSIYHPMRDLTPEQKKEARLWNDAELLKGFLGQGMSPTVAEGAFKSAHGRLPEADAVIQAKYSDPSFIKSKQEALSANLVDPTAFTHITHPEVQEAYPEMANLPVEIKPTSVMGNTRGEMWPPNLDMKSAAPVFREGLGMPYGKQVMREDIAFDPNEGRSTYLHELQHWIQQVENFAEGGNPGMFPNSPDAYRDYLRLGGEAESRLVQARRDMSAEERRMNYPWAKEQISDDRGNTFPLNELHNSPYYIKRPD